MKKLLLLSLCALTILAVLIAGCGKVSDETANILNNDALSKQSAGNPQRKIVVFKAGITDAKKTSVMADNNLQLIKRLGLINAVAVNVPEQARERVIAALSRRLEVLRIDDDLVITAIKKPAKPGDKPDDGDSSQPAEVLPWGVDRIDADLAWGISKGQGVKVAVLDTGIDYRHPDLAANVKGGVNIINTRKSYNDDNGHGTHVAGTIGAVDNEIGVIGAGSMASLYGVKVLDRRGSGYLSDLIAGLDWAIQNGIQVINMSLSSSAGNQSFHDAIIAAYNAGIVQVAAAGNSSGPVQYPAAYAQTIAVSAIDSNDQLAYFSSYGPEVEVTAPGVSILSTYKGSAYAVSNGTSMAAPHVAGACAVKLAQNNALTPAEVKAALQNSAEYLSGLTNDQQGAGLVDVEALVLQ
ncbi:S8 family peptidase [Candidatus Margulisiibacteriota bacterium]